MIYAQPLKKYACGGKMRPSSRKRHIDPMIINAGIIESKNVNLHPMFGVINPPTIEANITPTGAPDCINAPNLALNASGNVSLI